MILYVESNFLLELAFLQEGRRHCEELIKLASTGSIRLLLPAFCLGEPYEKLTRRNKKRTGIVGTLSAEIREISRSEPYNDFADKTDELVRSMTKSIEEERERLQQVLNDVLECAELIPLDAMVLRSAIQYQDQLGLSPQDSIVYASVLSHLGREAREIRKCFLTQNPKDFDDPDVKTELDEYNCKALFRFEPGLNYVLHVLTKPAT